MKKHFNKEHVLTKEDNEDFESSTKYWICGNIFVEGDVKVRDCFHVTGKYMAVAKTDCNKLQLQPKLQNCDRVLQYKKL